MVSEAIDQDNVVTVAQQSPHLKNFPFALKTESLMHLKLCAFLIKQKKKKKHAFNEIICELDLSFSFLFFAIYCCYCYLESQIMKVYLKDKALVLLSRLCF